MMVPNGNQYIHAGWLLFGCISNNKTPNAPVIVYIVAPQARASIGVVTLRSLSGFEGVLSAMMLNFTGILDYVQEVYSQPGSRPVPNSGNYSDRIQV